MQRLVEKVFIPSTLIERIETPLKEAVVGDKSYEILGAFRFPFTRPGQKNLNGRIYKHELWDKVFSKSITTISLADHPEDDGDPARIWAVMKNPGYNNDRTMGMVDCYIINNELGKTAMGVLVAGGGLGLSSSGIGDFEADGITVDPNSYELERYADWVCSPSYSVFGRIDDERLDTKVAEATDSKNISNNSNNALQEKGEQVMKTLTLREKRDFAISLKRIYEDVKSTKPIQERLNRAKEALTFYEDVDVDAYKKDFEELVKETEKEFEDTLAKGEQADALKKEAEEKSVEVSNVKKEVEELKNENNTLKKENDDLKKQVEASKKLQDEFDTVMSSVAESLRRNVQYDDYKKLREYAVKATKFYSEMKKERNLLQIQLQEQVVQTNALKEEKMDQYRKDAAAKARVEELRQRSETARYLQEKRLDEAREAEFMRNVNPDVLNYYNELLDRGENVTDFKRQILSKRTLFEAEQLFLQISRPAMIKEKIDRDLSTPLPVTNYRQITPDVQLEIPRGYI